MAEAAHETRLARVLGVPLAEDAVRQWPQSGEAIRGRERIAEVEFHFVGLRLGVGRRHVCGDTVVVVLSTDYGDGRVYRNVTVAELRDGQAVKVTDYWVSRSARHLGGRFLPTLSKCRRVGRGLPSRISSGTDVSVEAFPLTPEDQAILALESATVVGHTCKVIRVGPGAPGLDALRARVAERLPSTPALTRRLADTADGPAWVPDDRFDVTAHVAEVPGAPTDPVAVSSVVAALFAERLDRSRPLWRLDLIPVRGGGAALVWRVHHALADGTMLMRYAQDLLWDASAGQKAAGPAHHHATSHADDDVRRRGHLVGFLTREFARAHDSPFDGRIGTRREVAFASTGLERLHPRPRTCAGHPSTTPSSPAWPEVFGAGCWNTTATSASSG